MHTLGGVGRYTRILAATLLRHFSGELFLFLQREGDLRLILDELPPEERDRFILPSNVHLTTSKYPLVRRYLLHQWELPLRFKNLKLDAYLDPDYILPSLQNVRRFLVVHDVSPFVSPGLMGLKARIIYGLSARRSLQRADGIICVSEHTRQRLAKLFPKMEPKMRTLVSCLSPKFHAWAQRGYHHADSVRVSTAEGCVTVPRPFILFVGVEGPRKNLGVLTRAFLGLKERGLQHRLVMVGGKLEKVLQRSSPVPQMAVPSGPDFSLMRGLPSILKLGRVSDEDLVALYRHADLVALVSREEGFGYPILEGLAFRTPGLVGASSPMADYGGKGVVLVENVQDEAEVEEKIAQALKGLSGICERMRSSFDQDYFSPQRYFHDLMQILSEA